MKFANRNRLRRARWCCITGLLGSIVTRVADAVSRTVAVANPLGQKTQYQYSALNQVTRITDPLGNQTAMAYDGNGNLLSLTDPLSHTTSYTYDSMDRVATRRGELPQVEYYDYDPNGNVRHFTDRRGVQTTYTYDALDRVALAEFGTESLVSYFYDALGRLVRVVDSASGTITRKYDDLDRLLLEITPQGSVAYTYDNAGRRTSMSVSGQAPVGYSYDDADRVTQIVQGASTVGFSYDNTNRRTSLTLPNGVAMRYSYDAASQLTAINYELGAILLGNLTYTYDAAGRRIGVGGSYARTGLPDAVASAAHSANNQLTQWGSRAFSYDANGNTTSDGLNAYTWNARNQLASIRGNATADFQYDAFGRRAAKAIGLAATSYLYDGVNPVQELASGVPIANVLTGRVDEYFQRTDAAGPANFLTDALGSTVLLLGMGGNSLAEYTYEPFGNTAISGAWSNPFLFTGRENDGTGLYYYRARYYSPTLGRFLSEDPVGPSGGLNSYFYVGNSPVDANDPLGLWSPQGHDQMIWNALHPCGVSNADIWQMQRGSRWFDEQSQGTVWAPMHSMLDGTSGQTPEQAKQIRDRFVHNQMVGVASQLAQGAREQAMFNFGAGIHPLMDLTSPAHTDSAGNPIPWCGFAGCPGNRSQVLDHSRFESQGIETARALKAHPEAQRIANKLIRDWFQNVTGTRLPCKKE